MQATSHLPSTTDDLCQRLGRSRGEIAVVVRHISMHGYRQFALNAGGKRRIIHAPRPALKSLQRELLDKVLVAFPISDAIYSSRGRGVVANARQHLARGYMTTMDLEDCFPSIRLAKVRTAFERVGFDRNAVGLLSRIVTYQDMLPQGPPTSPAVLNLVFHPVDQALAEIAQDFNATYTRYMDDICFSADQPLERLAKAAQAEVRKAGFRLNRRKHRMWGPDDPHTVTKIIVNSTLNPEPEYLRVLTTEILNLRDPGSSLTESQIKGKIAWISQLDPTLGAELSCLMHSSRVTPDPT